MKTDIVLTGILRDKDMLLVVKRNGELLKEGLGRELKEEIGFIIDVDKDKTNIILSDEHCAYEWVTKNQIIWMNS